ncbi:hypothetical protein ACIPWL_28210 [Streptomyces sp. NPDC090023]|uniref:hypothetical protein n=1 Tax=unclassified Streptomyces TaxID=2593676 RepID=UPI00381563A3
MNNATARTAGRRTLSRTLVAAALTLAATGATVATSSTPAAADPIANCTPTKGAIVAVDFAPWGGSVVRGCDANPTTGYNLLHNGGFTTAGTQHDGPAFICRIGNPAFNTGTQYPTPAQDACVRTPPASAYWSYWIAPAGQTTWTYSPLGAMGDKPKAGEVEAWVYGSTSIDGTTGQPKFTPASVRAK